MTDSTHLRMLIRRWGAILVVVGLLAGACGSDDVADGDSAAAEETIAAEETSAASEDCRAGHTGEPLQLAYDIPVSNGVEVTCDLAYKSAPSGADQTLDVYKPAGTESGKALPTVIFFYINGDPDAFFWPVSREEWMTLDFKTGLDTHARVVASLGMVGITFDYSSYPMRSDYGEVSEENMGHAVQDAADLLAYVTANATDLNVDPASICVWTEGTGSLVGAHTALAGDPRPQCAVIFTGTLNEDYAGQYNPADLVSADMTPFFIARANADIYNNDGIDRFSFLAREAGTDQVVVERVQASYGFNVKQPELPADAGNHRQGPRLHHGAPGGDRTVTGTPGRVLGACTLALLVAGCGSDGGATVDPSLLPGANIYAYTWEETVDGATETQQRDYLLSISSEYFDDPGDARPLVLYLHGNPPPDVDALATEVPRELGPLPSSVVVAAPHATQSDMMGTDWAWFHRADYLRGFIDHVGSRVNIDSNRIYVTGSSWGANGAWALAAAYPDLPAAIITSAGGWNDQCAMCGRYDDYTGRYPDNICELADVPAWLFHGELDRNVPLVESQVMAEALEACGGEVHLTVIEGIGHGGIPLSTVESGLFDWMLSQRRGS